MQQITLEEFYRFSLMRFAMMVDKNQVDVERVKAMSEMFVRAAELKDKCNIILADDESIRFVEKI